MSLFHNSVEVHDSFSPERELVILQADTEAACDLLPEDTFSLIISSPPYNIGKRYENRVSLNEYLDWQTVVIRKLVRVLSPTGSLCWQVGNYVEDGEVFPLDIHFYPIFKNLRLQLRNRIIWHFEHGLHASNRFSGRYETLLWFTKTPDYVFNLDSVRVASKYPGKTYYKGSKRGQPSGNPLGKNPSDFWGLIAEEMETGIIELPNVKANHPEKTDHPCQFPVELVERCVLSMTNEGDWVLDPFAGVGSTLIAAAKHHRRAVGIDRDQAYCEVAKERLAEFFAGTLKLRPLGKPVHVPSGREKIVQRPIVWSEHKEDNT